MVIHKFCIPMNKKLVAQLKEVGEMMLISSVIRNFEARKKWKTESIELVVNNQRFWAFQLVPETLAKEKQTKFRISFIEQSQVY